MNFITMAMQNTKTVAMTALSPNLAVRNVNDTVEYYSEILGFELIMSVPEEGKFDWAMMKQGEITLMFQESKSLADEYPILKGRENGLMTLYINIDNIDTFYDNISDYVIVLKKLGYTSYGTKEFAIQDLNGYVLTFAGNY